MQDRVKYIVRKSLQGINTSCKTEANIPNMIVVKGTPRDYKQIGINKKSLQISLFPGFHFASPLCTPALVLTV